MQRLEVSGAVRLIYRSLGVKGLNFTGWLFGTYYKAAVLKNHLVDHEDNLRKNYSKILYILTALGHSPIQVRNRRFNAMKVHEVKSTNQT